MKTFKNPISGETIQLAKIDFPEKMYYFNAVEACKQLGEGWRLPSKYEWEIIFKEFVENTETNFEKQAYWINGISYEDDTKAFAYLCGNLNSGLKIGNHRLIKMSIIDECKVRAVKVISSN
jgi:hypothetical protein